MRAPKPEIPQRVRDARFVVMVPISELTLTEKARLAVLVPAIEVMVQEGLTIFALPVPDAGLLGQLSEIFDIRAVFGTYGALTPTAVQQSVDAGAAFVLANCADPKVIKAGTAADGSAVAVLPTALTPTEILEAARLGAPAVQVAPGDVLGGQYPERLRALLPDIELVARGGLGGWTAQRWLEAGAVACCLDETLTGDAFDGGKLADLRDRCRTFTTLLAEDAVPTS